MMLIPIKSNELWQLIPAVATGSQFGKCAGSPAKILQRILVAFIGGVVSLLISQSQLSTNWGPIWLIISFVFFLYLLWGPIIEAGKRNSELRKYPAAAIFEGTISNVYSRERAEDRREQANKNGMLELIESRYTLICIEFSDQDGYLGEVMFPLSKKHQYIKNGIIVRCIVLSEYKDFSRINAISDVWLPCLKLWVGDYPYLLRPAFEEICIRKLRRL